MKSPANIIIESLIAAHPGKVLFRRKIVDATAKILGFIPKDYLTLLSDEYRKHKGTYDYSKLITSTSNNVSTDVPANSEPSVMKLATGVNSVINLEAYIPHYDSSYVRWGEFADVLKIINSFNFYPVFISGLSGNGKTTMVEQACAEASREYVRVQISPETDEDDLIGGFRLINGETVFAKGPVIKAMERGAILLIDEIDRSSSKIMCLQGVLEGKPILIKKTGNVIKPAHGFNVIATANTKGKGSDDGRFVTATVIDEAFLERFVCTIEQTYPPIGIERKIVLKHMEKYGAIDEIFAERLVTWSEVIRKTFADGGVDEVISTRRLCHIAHTFSIFNDRVKAISMCISRFDNDTKTAFADLYSKIDASVTAPVIVVPAPDVTATTY